MELGFHDEESLGKVYDRRLIRRLWPYLTRHKLLIALSLLPIPLRFVLTALPALFIAVGLNYLVGSEPSDSLASITGWVKSPRASI